MFQNTWFLLALCFLAANAQNTNNTDAKTQQPQVLDEAIASDKVKVEPANISALYIGDLLRTKPKEDLEPAGSVHRPILSDRSFLQAASVPDRNYKTHGGHDQADGLHQYSQPVANHPRSAPVNIMGHLLTLKPVRVIKADTLSISRGGYSQGGHQKTVGHHYEGDECSKSGEHSTYGSEERPYAPPEQQTYRRAKQVAPEPEYRSEYDEEDRPHQTYSDTSSDTYDSKSYPTDTATNTKSHSSGSITRSKSTSSSKTVAPSRNKPPVTIVPKVLSHHSPDYHQQKNLGPTSSPHGSNQGYVVYKVKETQGERPGSSYHNSEREYPSYDRDQHQYQHKQPPRESPYSQYGSSEMKKPRKHSR